MNFGTNEAELDIIAAQQANSYSPDEIAYQLANENEDPELVEELADTATIEALLDPFIEGVCKALNRVLAMSKDGNPVRTHLELVNCADEIVEAAYSLRQELVAKVANRAEEIEEQGNGLHKQVIEES